jgi:hypothetical protein
MGLRHRPLESTLSLGHLDRGAAQPAGLGVHECVVSQQDPHAEHRRFRSELSDELRCRTHVRYAVRRAGLEYAALTTARLGPDATPKENRRIDGDAPKSGTAERDAHKPLTSP